MARWDFQSLAPNASVQLHGGVKWGVAGPRKPEFPDFDAENLALHLDGKGAYLTITDDGPQSKFDFQNGDAITLEAWVNPDIAGESQARYVISKGRSNSPGLARDNQNWALRVATAGGESRLSFLFASKPGPGVAHWHRWDSAATFAVGSGWHHIAVAYRFGVPESMRGWIDGRPTEGNWSLGGATKKPPVVDDDAVWIGSASGGNPSNSFHGSLDKVAVHRRLLSDAEIASRFRRVGGPRVMVPQPPAMPELGELPAGQVLLTISEGLPSDERWPEQDAAWPEETVRWSSEAFLLPRLPLRYDDWGLRIGWRAPLLLRIAADVELPAGEQRFLLRARGLGRLWVDGQLVAETEALRHDPPNGEERILSVPKPLLTGMRLPGYRQQEVIGDATIAP
ncbi:MAG: LamG domain-containing protein, partial [Novipirellula sp. JB048]